MLDIGHDSKIYLCTGYTDMRKGINGLSILTQSILLDQYDKSILFVFRGKKADRIKILWWDGQGFCLYYKCLDGGKFVWPKVNEKQSIGITKA
ncbi:IS66 family insertion sequence element accessory protein TnpB [Candidatus Tisiphia endosymbiont of Parasteatoda lunata]